MARSPEHFFSDDRVHAPIAAGDLLLTDKAGIDQFTDACARDPKVLAFRSKVEVVRD
jgi:2-methylcitrate dehydratase PrpD